MNQYAKELGIQRINGLLYVNLEDLLRYANSVTTDSSTAGMIYESLKEYLKTDEAKKDFIIMDENTVDNSNFLSNVAKSEEERYLERLGDTSIQRVDINYLVKQAESEEEVNQFYDALDSLNVGDKLTYEIIDGRLYIRNEKGQAVGTMPIPRIDPTTGAYIMYNDGWKTDILASNNGSITSSLKDLFTRLFTSNAPVCKEINSIIHELAYTNPSKERKAELHKQLVHNSEWKAAIAQNYTKNDVSTEKLANHLVKLLKFINQNSSVSQTVRNIQVKKSIENWFKKLNSSYDAVTAMAHNQEFNISVGTISDGELIRIVENDKVQAEQQALPVNEAIAGGVNPAIHKIGISDMYNVGMIRVSGIPSQGLAGVRGGNTFVIIPNRSGRPGYVQAFPAEVTDDYISQEAKDIIKTIHGEINRLLDAHAENPSEETYNAIKEFFSKLISNKDTNSSLFRGLAYSETPKGFTISFPNTSNFIHIFAKATNGGPSTLIQVGNGEFEANRNGKKTKNFSYNDAAARDAISELINNLRFQISFTYIDSDNRANVNLKGLARRENGKFVISVGDKTWTYHSYNDFMLRNNLVRLNTKPSDDGRSNYSRRGERSQRANQVFEIKIDRVTTSPVESNKETVKEPAKPATPTNIPVTEQVKNILASDSTNKGVDIVRAIIGTDSVFTEDTLKAFQNLGILPKNIKFDAEFNNRPNYENINAETNPATGEVTVGKRWLDMFSNPNSRRQAIRKLIHEELHNKLYIGPGNNHPKNNGYIRSAQQIYDEFKAAIENGELERKGFSKDVVEHLKQYLFEGNENGLEEFLVESLTSEELATALNSIDATFDKKRGAKNLFQKILELMSKVFGWDVRKGSLYEKELHTLRNAMNDNVEDKQAIEKVTIDKDKQQELPTEVKEEPVKEEPITVEPVEVQKPAAFGKDNSRKMRGMFRSSVTELNTTENYTPEMQYIKEQAITNGTFMKAPNGNPTNLNERQWLQVRTKAFKEWFGDWENNSSEASKVVDENGEPLVVYHGGRKPTIFDTSGKRSGGAGIQKGIKGSYFITTEEQARNYADIAEYKQEDALFELSQQLKLEVESGEITEEEANTIWNKNQIGVTSYFLNIRNPKINEYKYNVVDSKIDKDGHIFRKESREVEELSSITHTDFDGQNIKIYHPEYKSFAYPVNGYKTYKQEDEIEWVAINPNQIKSATDNIGTFSTTNDDIRYSSVTEQPIKVPSVTSFAERLPAQQQPRFAYLVARGEISTSCR